MANSESKTIVVSAVNVVVGGTQTILRDCLSELSKMAKGQNLRIVALVNNKELVYFDNIEYIEIPWAKKLWVNRLWTEYVTMKKISRKLQPIYLWLSLHDTTPSVIAQRRAVYCHNSFSFYKWKLSDIGNNYKIVLFALFTKYIYKKNIHKNNYVIVQQQWFKKEFIKMFGLSEQKLIVACPTMEESIIEVATKTNSKYQFFFPSSLGVHKNFELVCQAAELLSQQQYNNFEILLTINNDNGTYAQKIVKKYQHLDSVKFIGFQNRQNMLRLYAKVDCLLFPSKMESWGLPISEFMMTGKPMLLSDLAYARTTAEGSLKTAFFDPNNAKKLASEMEKLINGDQSSLAPVPKQQKTGINTTSWNELITILINNKIR